VQPGPPRILVVDDEPTIRSLIEELLVSLGCDVTTAADGADALKLLARQPPDLVITDWKMSALHGQTVVAAARETVGAVPILVVTGHAAVVYDALDPGDQLIAVLEKPFPLRDLRAEVERLLGRPL
jgi:CheY-like chemotaxis protein